MSLKVSALCTAENVMDMTITFLNGVLCLSNCRWIFAGIFGQSSQWKATCSQEGVS